MIKWEYITYVSDDPRDAMDDINQLGSIGWEVIQVQLIGLVGFVFILKRPLPNKD